MKKWMLNVLLVIFIGVFLVSGYFLVDYYMESFQEQASFDDLADMMDPDAIPTAPYPDQTETVDPPEDAALETRPPVSEKVTVTDPETGEDVTLLKEFAALYQKNNDIVGWIFFPDTKINYPVMQTPDQKDYYLYRNFDKDYSGHGCIYVQEDCDVFTPSDNLTLYGHRMKDGSMFNQLTRYLKEDYYKEHRYFTFNTLQERYTYEICYVFTISSSVGTPFPYHQFVDAYNEEEYKTFTDNCAHYALYDTGVVPQYGEKLITLSTCEYTHENGRLVVVARRLE